MREMSIKNRAGRTIDTIEQSLKKAQDSLDKPLEDFTWDELLSYIESLKKRLSKNTLSLYTSKFIQFYKFCFDKTDDVKYNKMVKSLKSISTGIKRTKLKPSEILNPEDIKKLINAANIERDRCIVAVLFESGMRRGELLSLTNNNVKMDELKQLVTFEIPDEEGCKTGSRTIPCAEIYGYVQDWLKCNKSDMFMPVSENGLKRILIALFDKAGIKKPSNVHHFRHSAITHTVHIGLQPNEICMRFWGSPTSDMLETYIHLSESFQSNAYLKAKGLAADSDNKIVINPIASRCINCGKLIQSGNLCIQCKENADLKTKMEQQGNKLSDDAKRLIELEVKNTELEKQMLNMEKKINYWTKVSRKHFEILVENSVPVKEPDS